MGGTSVEAMSDLTELEVSRQFPARRIEVEHASGPLVLRPTLMTDAAEIYRAVTASLDALRAFMPWSHLPTSERQQLERLRQVEVDYFSGREMLMALFRGDEMLCMVGLHPRTPLNPRALEVGYWAPTPRAGRGWTTLGVQIAALYAFDRLGCDRLQVMCDEANAGSRRVIEKCGFAHEGTLRNATADQPQLAAQGYRATGKNPLFALFPDTIEALPWVAPLRPRLRYVNLAGHVVPAGSPAR